MRDDLRFDRYFAVRARGIELPPASLSSVIDRAARRHRHRRAAVSACTAVAVLTAAVSVSSLDGRPTTGQVASRPAGGMLVDSSLSWTVVSPRSGLSSSQSTVVGPGNVIYSLSTAPGVADPERAPDPPVLYRSVDGKIEHDVCLIESQDGGRTWDAEPRVLAENRWAVSAPVRELPDGTLLLGAYTGDDSTAYGAVLRSTDGGQSWSEPVAIDPHSGVRLDAETDVLQLPNGEILAALRGDGQVNLHFATSADQGLTWSKIKDSGFLGHSPHLTRLSTGEILLTHRQPATSLHISRDDAKSWQGPFEIDSVGGAYPSTVELKDGTVLVVYYEEGPTSAVRAARFRVTADGIEKLGWE